MVPMIVGDQRVSHQNKQPDFSFHRGSLSKHPPFRQLFSLAGSLHSFSSQYSKYMETVPFFEVARHEDTRVPVHIGSHNHALSILCVPPGYPFPAFISRFWRRKEAVTNGQGSSDQCATADRASPELKKVICSGPSEIHPTNISQRWY